MWKRRKSVCLAGVPPQARLCLRGMKGTLNAFDIRSKLHKCHWLHLLLTCWTSCSTPNLSREGWTPVIRVSTRMLMLMFITKVQLLERRRSVCPQISSRFQFKGLQRTKVNKHDNKSYEFEDLLVQSANIGEASWPQSSSLEVEFQCNVHVSGPDC